MAYQDKEKERAYHRAYRKANREKINGWAKAWRKANPEKAKRSDQVYYQANPEKRKTKNKLYHKTHREERRIYNETYQKANPEKIKALQKSYRKANPEKINAWDRNKYHKRRSLKFKVPYQIINHKEIYMRDDWKCQICHKRVDKKLKYPDPMSASLDHIVPLGRNCAGSHIISNVQLAHWQCNIEKNTNILPQGEQLRLF